MGQHDCCAARTAGANVRDDKQKVRADWPPEPRGRKKKPRKVISAKGAADSALAGVSQTALVRAAERLDVRGLYQSHGWANAPSLEDVEVLQQTEQRTQAGKENLAHYERIAEERRKTLCLGRNILSICSSYRQS